MSYDMGEYWDFVDTRGLDEVAITVSTVAPRTSGGVPPAMAQAIVDLVMGVPVPGAILDQYGLAASRFISREQYEAHQAEEAGQLRLALN